MKGINSSFVPVGFSRTGTERLKNWSGKCEGPGEGDQWVKEPEWEMRRTGRGGLDGLKNRSGKCEGPGEGVDEVKNRSGKCEGPRRGGGRPMVV
jgi:hypothetical protein